MTGAGSSGEWRRYRREQARKLWWRALTVRGVGAVAVMTLAGSCTVPSAEAPRSIATIGRPAAPRLATIGIVSGDADVTAVQPIADFSNMSPDAAGAVPDAGAITQAPIATWNAGPAAQPFSLAGQSSVARVRAHLCLATAIYYEADSESDDGERAVAQVVLNRVRHSAFPASICGVVYQGSENPNHCQFSFACDGSMARHTVSVHGWMRASRIADAALAGSVFKPVGLAINYHTLAVSPRWSPLLVPATIVGAHIFYRLQGPSGMPATFAQNYARIEPVPGPHAPLILPVAPSDELALAIPVMLPSKMPVPPVRQMMSDPAPDTQAPAPITPADQILPRWRDSGTLIKR